MKNAQVQLCTQLAMMMINNGISFNHGQDSIFHFYAVDCFQSTSVVFNFQMFTEDFSVQFVDLVFLLSRAPL